MVKRASGAEAASRHGNEALTRIGYTHCMLGLIKTIAATCGFGAPAPRKAQEPGFRLPGRFLILDGLEYECVVKDFGLGTFEVMAAARPDVGQPVFLDVEDIGLVVGTVAEHIDEDRFEVTPFVPEERRERLASRVAWKQGKEAEEAARRAAPRIVPTITRTKVQISEEMFFMAEIVNVSTSGALIAITRVWRPLLGAVVFVGKRKSTVVRHTPTGFAVRFDEPLPMQGFDESVIL